MQTFLPFPLFTTSADVLDNKRLGKQRVEAMQIYNIITGKSKSEAWKNHPAVLMWRGYDNALAYYYNCIRREWIKRGIINTMPELPVDENNIQYPSWLGVDKFHMSHRSNLKRKFPEFYGKYNWSEPDNLPYVWPNTKDSGGDA